MHRWLESVSVMRQRQEVKLPMCDVLFVHKLKALQQHIQHAIISNMAAYLKELPYSFNEFRPAVEWGRMEFMKIWRDQKHYLRVIVDGYDVQNRNRAISRIRTQFV
jgi:hypothetical protein